MCIRDRKDCDRKSLILTGDYNSRVGLWKLTEIDDDDGLEENDKYEMDYPRSSKDNETNAFG